MRDQTFSWQHGSDCCQTPSGQQTSKCSFVIKSTDASQGLKITQLFPITSTYTLHEGISLLRRSRSRCLKTAKLYSGLKEKTGLPCTFKNMQQQKCFPYLPNDLIGWNRGRRRAHNVSLIAVNLYLCARVLGSSLCALRAAVFA